MTTSAADSETISFPPSFAWGTSTSAYQVEGGWMEGRRGLSIWDSFAHTPGKIKTGQTGDVAADHFHRFRADVKLMAQMSLKYYRFSIAWARIMPGGTGAVNDEGVAFYSALIDELLKNGIHPVATLYHWDLPLPLQLEHDGWLSHHTANAFVAYARVCFERFGDRVKHWITINEPYTHVVHGFALGDHAPGRMMRPTTEPYIAGHYLLLAHAHAVAVYRQQYAPTQKGIVSIALNSDWREPLTASAADVAAAQRSMEFNLGWFADPIYFGDYPPAMRAQLGARLPTFSAEQRAMLTNSSDFFALQHYASMMISSRPENEALADGTFHKDENVKWHNTAGARKNMLGWDIAPFGLYKLAKWVHRRYSPAGGIVVTENGIPLDEEASEVARRDNHRVCYVKRYLQQLKRAMDEGVAVRRRRRAGPTRRPTHPASPTHCAHTRPSRPPGARLLLLVVHRQLRVGGGHARALRPRVHRLRHAAPRRQDVGRLLRAPRPDELVHAHAVGVQRHDVGHVALPGGGGRADEAHVRAQRHEPLGPQRHAEQRLGRGGRVGVGRGRRARADDDEAEGGAGDADGAVRAARRDAGAPQR